MWYMPFSEHRREIHTSIHEKFNTAELAKLCIDFCLQSDEFVLSDTSYFEEVPFDNNNRTYESMFTLKGASFSHLNLRIPKKDPNIKIRVEAFDMVIPGRVIRFEEAQSDHELIKGIFFVDDTDNINSGKFDRQPEPYIESDELANLLLAQAGLGTEERTRKLAAETDPVQFAARAISHKAKKHVDVRQVHYPLAADLEFYGEAIEEVSTDNPMLPPKNRIYRAWVNQHHIINGQPVVEQILIQFSPDDILLASNESRFTTISVNVRSEDPNTDAKEASTAQALSLEDGGVHTAFSRVYELLQNTVDRPLAS
jgi:hypothetical protein